MNNKPKLILTDVDGVLCNWNDAFEKFAISKGFARLPNTDQHYNLGMRFDAPSNNTMHKLVVEFNDSAEIATLEALPGAVKYVEKLVKEGFRFIAITSLSDAPEALKYRTQNLHNLFGNVFDEIICLKIGSAKGHVLERWADSGLFWIEDHFMNAEAGYEVGLKPILVDTPYNAHFKTDLFSRTSMRDPWREIHSWVLFHYGYATMESFQ